MRLEEVRRLFTAIDADRNGLLDLQVRSSRQPCDMKAALSVRLR
jgi:hypothetical protein